MLAQQDCPRMRAPLGGRYRLRRGQRFVVAPSMVLTVVGCQRSSVRLDIRAAHSRRIPVQRGLRGRRSFVTLDTEQGKTP
jgi:hypothetical protein